MQVIHFTEEHTGSFDWELPQDVATAISSLPAEQQHVVIDELTLHIRGHLHLLIGSVQMGSRVPLAFELINSVQSSLAKQLMQMAMS